MDTRVEPAYDGADAATLICRHVQPRGKKDFTFLFGRNSNKAIPSCSSKGRFAIVTSAEQDAVDATDAQRRSAFAADGEVVWF